MSQFFVVHGIGRDRVGVSIDITDRAWVRWAVERRQEWIPDADATGVVRSYVTHLNRPATTNLTLQSEIVLLRVRRVGIKWSTGERCQVD